MKGNSMKDYTEKKYLTCIGCPMGCQLTVEMKNGEVISVSGNNCPRGEVYARKEVTNPTRIVTGTVPVLNGTLSVVSCKTREDIPKGKIFECLDEMKKITVSAPVRIGDILLENVAGTGVPIVATKNIDSRSA